MDLVKMLIGGGIAAGLGVGGYFLGNSLGMKAGYDLGHEAGLAEPVTMDKAKEAYTNMFDTYSSIESNNMVHPGNSNLNLYVCEEMGLKAVGLENQTEGLQAMLGYDTNPFGMKKFSLTNFKPEEFCNGSYEKVSLIPKIESYEVAGEINLQDTGM